MRTVGHELSHELSHEPARIFISKAGHPRVCRETRTQSPRYGLPRADILYSCPIGPGISG